MYLRLLVLQCAGSFLGRNDITKMTKPVSANQNGGAQFEFLGYFGEEFRMDWMHSKEDEVTSSSLGTLQNLTKQ